MTIKLIVGIGNIGSQYINTRHNYGHKYIYLLAKKYKIILYKDPILCGFVGILEKFKYLVRLFIPNTYINDSGTSVSKCVDFYKLSTREILIVHDDLDLMPGQIRLKLGKKMNASHHGIQNIIEKLNNCAFYRLRIGIGRPKNKQEVINFVLSIPPIYENKKIDYVMQQAILYTEDIICNNFIKVMHKLHSMI